MEVRIMNQQPHTAPEVGYWYDSNEFPECFKVVALDDKQALIEIQYFDGEVAELDFDAWQASHPHEIPEPEDASAPYELDHEEMMDLLNEVDIGSDRTLNDHLRHIDDEESHWD
jgi:hypothetical protein